MRYNRYLAHALATAFLLAAIGGIVVPAYLDRSDLSLLALYVSLPLVVAGGLYATSLDRTTGFPTIDGNEFRATVAAFLVLQGVSFVLLGRGSVRPFSYYAVVALLATVVFVQIVTLDSGGRSPVILAEIGAILLNISWGVTFNYHYYFGRTDVFPHAWWVDRVVTTGYVTEALAVYQFHPLWHVLGAVEIGVLNLPVEPRYALFFTNGLVFLAAVVGVYLIAREVSGGGFAFIDAERIALTAALVTAMNSFVILYAMYSIPRSVTSVLGILALFSVLRTGYRYLALFSFVTVGIAAYHTVSVPFILVLFATLYLLQFPFLGRRVIRLYELALMAGIQLAYWAGYATNTFDRIRLSLFRPRDPTEGGVGVEEPVVTELVNLVSFSVLILFIAYGALVVLTDRERPALGRLVVLGGLVLAGASFPGPLQLVELADSFNILRLGQYTYPVISVAAAVGLMAVASSHLSNRAGTRPVFLGLALLLVLSMSFFAVSNDFVASDNPLVERESFYTFYLTEAEETGFNTLASTTDGFVFGDQVTCKYLNHGPYPEKCHILEADLEDSTFLTNTSDDVLLLRTTELDRRPITLYETSIFRARPSYVGALSSVGANDPLWKDLATHDRIYASEDVVGYSSVEGAELDSGRTNGRNGNPD